MAEKATKPTCAAGLSSKDTKDLDLVVCDVPKEKATVGLPLELGFVRAPCGLTNYYNPVNTTYCPRAMYEGCTHRCKAGAKA